MENHAKKNFSFLLSIASMGAVVGVILSSLYGPQLISWWFEPPVELGYNCRPATDWAMKKLLTIQALSLVGGAGLALLIKRLFSKKS